MVAANPVSLRAIDAHAASNSFRIINAQHADYLLKLQQFFCKKCVTNFSREQLVLKDAEAIDRGGFYAENNWAEGDGLAALGAGEV